MRSHARSTRALATLVFAGVLASHAGAAIAAEPACEAVHEDPRPGGPTALDVDTVWSGARVGFAGLAVGTRILVAYYDRERILTLAELDPAARRVCRLRLDSQFAGWDSHDQAALALAPDGSVHLAANMHVSPLIYGHTDASGSLTSFRLDRMTGEDEAFVTYPTFVGGGTRPLAFLYRAGRSGDGQWLADTWGDGRWTRAAAVFAGASQAGPVSAYPSPLVRDPQGREAVAVVWRRTSDVRSNFAVSYGRTEDFRSWTGSDGRTRPAPLGVDDADIVEVPGENSGLLNNARLVANRAGTPVVLYTRYGPDGRNVLIAARPGPAGWVKRTIAESAVRVTLTGGGSIAEVPHFGAESDGDAAQLTVIFPGEKPVHMSLDLETLAAAPSRPKPPPASAPREGKDSSEFSGLAEPVHVTLEVRDGADPSRLRGWLTWVAQAPNRDHPRACDITAREACNPHPTVLRYFPNN